MLDRDEDLIHERGKILLISDKGFASGELEKHLTEENIELLRPHRKNEKVRPGESLLRRVHPANLAVRDGFRGWWRRW
ncbi:hypothetical protein FAIPA1_170082 [Frankia sp. AiPs1]|uniref:hypothetical protein n=1 Tax=Frankia sp. AiPa1 TaxID=573492 RepID=UPI00202B4C78|nr:hypothetical protein [Frankia sp. AiPa1]MCL9760314.1 hypothetical protein [Frankia sp. AiPa1]